MAQVIQGVLTIFGEDDHFKDLAKFTEDLQR